MFCECWADVEVFQCALFDVNNLNVQIEVQRLLLVIFDANILLFRQLLLDEVNYWYIFKNGMLFD